MTPPLAFERPVVLRKAPSTRSDGDVRVLSDSPISDLTADYFGFADFAVALAEIVDNDLIDTPLTIVVSAPWGAGKTSLAGMMETLFRRWVSVRGGERPRLVCRFDAWEHSDAPHLGAALAAKVARTANSRRAWWRRVLTPLPASMLGPEERWRRSLILFAVTFGAALTLTAIPGTRHASEKALHLKSVVGGVGWLALLLILIVVWRRAFAAAKDAARFIDDPRSQAATGSMTQVKHQLGGLISQASSDGRVVIFIDDLERCPASRAVEVFEVASQLLAHTGVVTILLADTHALAAAAHKAYSGDADEKSADVGRRYLEKLVQLELQLPPPSRADMKRLLQGRAPEQRSVEEAELNKPQARPTLTLDQGMVWAQVGAVLGLTFAGFYYLSLVITTGAPTQEFTSVATVSTGAGIISALTAFAISRVRKARQELRLVVRSELKAAVSDLPETDLAQLDEDDPRWPQVITNEDLAAFASREVESLLTIESPEVNAVERFIQRYPPPLPRSAKRMVNHARLLTKIAREREMFGGAPKLTPQHLGKWIVLRERWPLVANHFTKYPERVREFERIARKAGLGATAEYTKLVGESAELIELLAKRPALGSVIERLIYFEPARTPRAKS